MDAEGLLHTVKQVVDTKEGAYVHRFELAKDGHVFEVTLLDGGNAASTDRYAAEIWQDGERLAASNPEADLETAVRNAYRKAKSHLT